ncbi:MAG: hypothetical protein CMD10_03340 [Flavobacteriales bacterium]|nr:hypothetical protein [Flavobacteriales bacterium]
MKHIFNFKFGFFLFFGIILGMIYGLFSVSNKVSESDVEEKLDEIFQIVDNDVDRFSEIVTEDFFIFENSKRYSTDEFIDFVKSFDIIESKREFKNVEIDTDFNSAHVSLEHHGEFDINTPDGKVRLIFDWLESTYLIEKDDELKFKFYFSEAIFDTIVPIN